MAWQNLLKLGLAVASYGGLVLCDDQINTFLLRHSQPVAPELVQDTLYKELYAWDGLHRRNVKLIECEGEKASTEFYRGRYYICIPESQRNHAAITGESFHIKIDRVVPHFSPMADDDFRHIYIENPLRTIRNGLDVLVRH